MHRGTLGVAEILIGIGEVGVLRGLLVRLAEAFKGV
jgi:hypothetical protein